MMITYVRTKTDALLDVVFNCVSLSVLRGTCPWNGFDRSKKRVPVLACCHVEESAIRVTDSSVSAAES